MPAKFKHSLLALSGLTLMTPSLVFAQATQPANTANNPKVQVKVQQLQQQTRKMPPNGVVKVAPKRPALDFDASFSVNPPAGDFATAAPAEGQARIQLAILLDTSSSMNGLIDQARQKLWQIVNELAKTQKNGQAPLLEVALFEYGKSSVSASEGYIRMLTPLTVDLDAVSEELFKLNTGGGSEHCGQVIAAASNSLKWSDREQDLRIIFIAGNEPFTQGQVYYGDAINVALGKKIVVNTIHCGNADQGIKGEWNKGAALGGGEFMNIDQNASAVTIKTPYDEELAKLSQEINKTYIGFGARGRQNKMRQEAMDNNATNAAPSVAAERATTKGSSMYNNANWDMVDAVEKEGKKIEDFKDEELPEEMRKMSMEERKAHLKKLSDQRKAISKRIGELSKQRAAYIEAERKKQAEEAGEETLDEAIIKAVKKQAAEGKFESAK